MGVGSLILYHRKMWSGVLNKPKQGKGFRDIRVYLIREVINYDKGIERKIRTI